MRRPLIHIAIIAAIGLMAYSNTFDVPFQWDEHSFIADNPIVKDFSYFLEPSKAKEFEHYDALRNRYVGYFTFAVNYKLHGLDVTGYHIFNFAVHIANALLVYVLIILSFKAPMLEKSNLREHSKHVGLFAALLFVTHPVQTEAVTYIFQRLASLSAFFFLLSLVSYMGYRLSMGTGKYALYMLSLVSAVLAMKTKENAFTLPVIVALFEFFLFAGAIARRALVLAPFMLTLLIIPFALMADTERPLGETIRGITGGAMYHSADREHYFFTELRVIATYLRLLFLPAGQNLDYDYPVYRSFFDAPVILSFLFFLSILAVAVYLFFRLRFKRPASRLAVIGIFWFFITISVESSMIMLPTLIDEYRLYLPSVGFFLGTVTGSFMLIAGIKSKSAQRLIILSIITIPLVLAYASYSRNNVWKSKGALWSDVVEKSPENARGRLNLGLSYASKGLTDMAIEQYQLAIRLQPDYVEAHNNLGLALAYKGLHDEAIKHYRHAIKMKPDFAEAYNNLGLAYEANGLTYKAIEQYRIAMDLKFGFAEAHNNLGLALASQGDYGEAIEQYGLALKYKPEDIEARYNLGLAYLSSGRGEKARGEFSAVLKTDPNHQARQFLKHISAKP